MKSRPFEVFPSRFVTASWTVETYQQFDAGDATSAFITSTGELRPGWDTKRVKLEGDAVWASLRLADGSVLLGSDVGGSIYKVTGDSAKQLVKLDGGIAVVSLAQTSDGAVWAGAMPGHKIWRVDPTSGKATAGPQLKDAETIWSWAAPARHCMKRSKPSAKPTHARRICQPLKVNDLENVILSEVKNLYSDYVRLFAIAQSDIVESLHKLPNGSTIASPKKSYA